jgi:hypothetical protein
VSKRQQRREDRREDFYQAKLAAASTDEARAKVTWQVICGYIAAKPDAEQAAAWESVAGALAAQLRVVTPRGLRMRMFAAARPGAGAQRPDVRAHAREDQLNPQSRNGASR